MGILSFLFGQRTQAPSEQSVSPATSPNAADMGRGLRLMMLSSTAEEHGMEPDENFPRVYGVLMDFPAGQVTATVFAACDGAASLYTTSTFGIIGGQGHEAVRRAAMQFVHSTDRLFDEAKPTTEYPYPATGKVRFYLLAYDGVRVIETDLEQIEKGTSPYEEFFFRGQQVLTELRIISS